jgi:hypothetical protein
MKIMFRNKCQRCGLHYSANETVCPHCNGLTDQQVKQIKLKRGSKGTGNAMLDRVIIYTLGLIVVGVVIYKLNQV